MDGVEDREGVAVVAASSRPDLLDPALLRPGRLDKALYCPLPGEVYVFLNIESRISPLIDSISTPFTQSDREEILAALCKAQNADTAGLDLKELAALTSGFTGADLNAVITQARLSAFEDAVALASVSEQVAFVENRKDRRREALLHFITPSLA